MIHVINRVTADVIEHAIRHVSKRQSCNLYVIWHVILCNDSCNQPCNSGCKRPCNKHVITGQSCNVYVI